jgi:hypothetical protein
VLENGCGYAARCSCACVVVLHTGYAAADSFVGYMGVAAHMYPTHILVTCQTLCMAAARLHKHVICWQMCSMLAVTAVLM